MGCLEREEDCGVFVGDRVRVPGAAFFPRFPRTQMRVFLFRRYATSVKFRWIS